MQFSVLSAVLLVSLEGCFTCDIKIINPQRPQPDPCWLRCFPAKRWLTWKVLLVFHVIGLSA